MMKTSSKKLEAKSRALLAESSTRKEIARWHRDIAELARLDAGLEVEGSAIRLMFEAKCLEHEANAAHQERRAEAASTASVMLFQLAGIRASEERLAEYAGRYLTV